MLSSAGTWYDPKDPAVWRGWGDALAQARGTDPAEVAARREVDALIAGVPDAEAYSLRADGYPVQAHIPLKGGGSQTLGGLTWRELLGKIRAMFPPPSG